MGILVVVELFEFANAVTEVLQLFLVGVDFESAFIQVDDDRNQLDDGYDGHHYLEPLDEDWVAALVSCGFRETQEVRVLRLVPILQSLRVSVEYILDYEVVQVSHESVELQSLSNLLCVFNVRYYFDLYILKTVFLGKRDQTDFLSFYDLVTFPSNKTL
eukprot:CAMPEP_0116895574 /NCGR_PEP_ID=MMETSP0467-20121206/5065_1 /TAXON_ID=283647 /ORGANISM="Mesodinium pulex, Strain SPMC105" /LENGTH=158 /DNA_ID=CAMNT_0004566375 /DNA_START=124 /DNA_END=600 /DNA_ORIENTATION=-